MITWTHPLRIFRAAAEQRHDLSIVFGAEDIYGRDVWGRLVPDDSALYEFDGPAQFGVLKVTARLVVPGDVDVDTGYFVQVKKPRVVAGRREPCSAVTTKSLLIGDTEVALDTTVGFRSGDTVLVSEGDTRQLCRVHAVTDDSVNLYSDFALENDLEAGAPVVACHFYRAVGRRMPRDGGPIQVLTLVAILGTGGMA